MAFTVKSKPLSSSRWKSKNTPVRIWKMVSTLQLKLITKQNMADTGKWLKNELTELGPAFIKMGQFVSTRSDVLPKEINEELKLLQDSITSIPYEDIQGVLHEEYGSLYDSIFLRFDTTPIASASIGQVHRAILKKGKTPVVVKIQKPYIDEQIRSDLVILKNVCRFFKLFNAPRAGEFENILQQYEDFLTGELDYLTEQSHMLLFKENLEPNMPVIIPKPYSEYTTKRVLVMQDVPSIKITEFLKNPDNLVLKSGEQLADELMDLFLYQIIMNGVVHCDPHPGNIGVDELGRLVLYDFGNVTYLGENFKSKVQQLIVAVYQKDVDEFLDLLISMKILQISEPMELLELKGFFVYILDYLESVDFQKLRNSILDNKMLQQSQIKVKIEPQFLSLFRVFSLLDGTCLALNPSFSYFPVLQPYFQDVLRDFEFIDYRIRKDVQKITSFPKMLQNTDNNILQINRRMEYMNDHTRKLRTLMIMFVVLDNVDDPVKLVCLLPLALLATRIV